MDLIERCYELDWTDGLPVVPPTPDRVEAMLAGRDPNQVIAVLDPSRAEATMEAIAANAVMAGCLPSYFPVVLAAVQAAADPAFGLDGVLTTVHSQCPLILVNGPIVDDLGFNSGSNVLASGTRANATVGRALALVMRNIAGAKAGALDPKTLGHPGKYSYCIAENEAVSPWPSFAADRGFSGSTVTLFAADAPLCLAHLGGDGPDGVLGTISDALPIAGTYTIGLGGTVLIVISPEHAALCDELSKQEIRDRLFAAARRPIAPIRELGAIGFSARAMGRERRSEGDIAVVTAAEKIHIVVAGGEMGGYTAVIFCGSGVITRPIEGGSSLSS